MPTFLVTVTDIDPLVSPVDADWITNVLERVGSSSMSTKAIEVSWVELAGATAACNAVSEAAPFDEVGPLVEFARKTGMALHDTKEEMK
jgi:hypothetical protein